ncbi:MAG: replication-associated recombination protein RarA [Chloroflexi bacterium]|nr:replication-associated recombination protein RarA [Chloroflexota bacterium]|tara:strand:- start:2526 stop:3860 length:1335 start_codon:yes stop_codon:yes gene_type:complete
MTEDLFAHKAIQDLAHDAPLAARMRPVTLDAFIGQKKLVGPNAPLRNSIERDEIWSVILWGPPGTGKTSLARIAANETSRNFVELSAISAGVKDVRTVLSQAAEARQLYSKRTLVFLDEIHRFNKAQQDSLLAAVEDGIIALWGATTENPYFEINASLLSRMRVLRLEQLTNQELQEIVQNAIKASKGLGPTAPRFESNAIKEIIAGAAGDARVALNRLEATVVFATEQHIKTVESAVVTAANLERQVRYDRSGDEHYDTISAYIKSVRGSDPDAALFWLAKMIEGGESPEFIARRIVILASEDIGNADPSALSLAVASASAVERLGMPEARFALSQVTIYLAAAPKSNATGRALDAATQAIRDGADLTVPSYLRSTNHPNPTSTEKAGPTYKYPHNYPDNFVAQHYMSNSEKFYDGHGSGRERALWKQLNNRRASGKDSGSTP